MHCFSPSHFRLWIMRDDKWWQEACWCFRTVVLSNTRPTQLGYHECRGKRTSCKCQGRPKLVLRRTIGCAFSRHLISSPKDNPGASWCNHDNRVLASHTTVWLSAIALSKPCTGNNGKCTFLASIQIIHRIPAIYSSYDILHMLDRGVISARPVATPAKQVRTGASPIQKGSLPATTVGPSAWRSDLNGTLTHRCPAHNKIGPKDN